MNCTIKINSDKIADFQNIVNLMFQLNYDFISYIEFYNIGNIMQRLSKLNFRSNFSNSKKYSLVLNPNEQRDFLRLVAMSENLINRTPYYKAMLMEYTNQLHKHSNNCEHQKSIFIDKTLLTIPKQISQ